MADNPFATALANVAVTAPAETGVNPWAAPDQKSWLNEAKVGIVKSNGVVAMLVEGEEPALITDENVVRLVKEMYQKRDTVKVLTGDPETAVETIRFVFATKRNLGRDGRYHWEPIDRDAVMANAAFTEAVVKFLAQDMPKGYLNWVPELSMFILREVPEPKIPTGTVNFKALVTPALQARQERAAARATAPTGLRGLFSN